MMTIGDHVRMYVCMYVCMYQRRLSPKTTGAIAPPQSQRPEFFDLWNFRVFCLGWLLSVPLLSEYIHYNRKLKSLTLWTAPKEKRHEGPVKRREHSLGL